MVDLHYPWLNKWKQSGIPGFEELCSMIIRDFNYEQYDVLHRAWLKFMIVFKYSW